MTKDERERIRECLKRVPKKRFNQKQIAMGIGCRESTYSTAIHNGSFGEELAKKSLAWLKKEKLWDNPQPDVSDKLILLAREMDLVADVLRSAAYSIQEKRERLDVFINSCSGGRNPLES